MMHDVRSQITRRINSKSYQRAVKEEWMLEKTQHVCLHPNVTEIPRMATKTTNGTRQSGRQEFLLPVAANKTNNKIKGADEPGLISHATSCSLIVLTSSEKQFADDM
jgi:hypothetical protein